MTALVLIPTVLLAAAQPFRLAYPGFVRNTVDASSAAFFDDYFAQQLQMEEGVVVVRRAEAAGQLGLPPTAELFGCATSDARCALEAAKAIDADALVIGELQKLGKGYAIDLRAVAVPEGRALGAYTARVKNDEEALVWLGDTAKLVGSVKTYKMTAAAAATAPPPAVAAGPPTLVTPGPNWRVIAPAIAGGALFVVGGVSYLMARGRAGMLEKGDDAVIRTHPDLRRVSSEGQTFQTAGFVLMGAGVAALAVSGVLAAQGSAATAMLWPGGGGLAIAGEWP